MHLVSSGNSSWEARLKEDQRKNDHLLRLEKCRAKASIIAEVETRLDRDETLEMVTVAASEWSMAKFPSLTLQVCEAGDL